MAKNFLTARIVKVISNDEFSHFHHGRISCIRNSKYSTINRIFLLLNWKNAQLKNRPVKVCDANYTFNKVLVVLPICSKESPIFVCPNFPKNTRIQCLLGTFNIWIKLSDTGVDLWDERVASSKLCK